MATVDSTACICITTTAVAVAATAVLCIRDQPDATLRHQRPHHVPHHGQKDVARKGPQKGAQSRGDGANIFGSPVFIAPVLCAVMCIFSVYLTVKQKATRNNT